jgi:hypothetical protein
MELRPYYDRPYHTSCKNMKQNNIRTRTSCCVNKRERVLNSGYIVSYMYNSDCHCYNELTQVLPGTYVPLFLEVLLEVNAEQCHVFGTKKGYQIRREFCTRLCTSCKVTCDLCEKRRSLTCITTCVGKFDGSPLYVILYMYNST